jgi:malonate-semialdehyde dehydrogenase (acetylating)/methylmalonate-semialdehyde dehydrogenase
MNTIGHFIGGRRVVGQSERYADVFNPSTGDVQARVALASARELRDAVLVAKSAQIGWAATNPQRRARVLMKFLEIVQKEYDSLPRAKDVFNRRRGGQRGEGGNELQAKTPSTMRM